MKERNVWVAGLEGVPEARPIDEADLRGALAIVIGSEGSGISRLVRESCDFLVRRIHRMLYSLVRLHRGHGYLAGRFSGLSWKYAFSSKAI